MKKAKNNNLAFFYPKIDCIWKPHEKAPSEIAIDLLVKRWIGPKVIDAGIKREKKFFTKGGGLFLVP